MAQYGQRLIPIEVKSGGSGKLRSLMQFMERADHDLAVRIYSGTHTLEKMITPSGKKFRLLSLPFYLVDQMSRLLKEANGEI